MALKKRKKKTFDLKFLKTSSLSGDKILLSKKRFFLTKHHYKSLILSLLSLKNKKNITYKSE
ncbi:hypothetical protein E0I26_04275 [Flavobacterium rhamnosiphilum]|uniref:Uncharacterized protein n=1 Tax=Flavobacterium rhamnosiphilum TaxID=2541724 RepID=A0A4R5FAY8_9FLAO|nr:hypothetical protein E0I26_04275 [Flavobacterium rhamnosiphilum]